LIASRGVFLRKGDASQPPALSVCPHIPYNLTKGKLPFSIGLAAHSVGIFEIRKGISKSKASINQNFKQKMMKIFETEKNMQKS